jgi:prepilin-type N-terminal cleavage/methylation domain-containing protein
MRRWSLGVRREVRGSKRVKGFTLIELAIALVIIGIIAGAILKGQDLINSAKVKRFVDDLKGIETALWTFYDKKGRLPGDCNNDGLIDYTLTTTAPTYSTSTTAPTGYCDSSSSSTASADTVFNELKYAELLSSTDPNSELARHEFNGYFAIGNSNSTVNAIVAYNIPAWAAKMIDKSIDKVENGQSGRLRRFDTTGDWPATSTTNVAIIYYFDKTP